MKLIIGLGNPGERFENTRHNVGFIIADSLRSIAFGQDIWEESKKFQALVCRPKAIGFLIAKPQTFMNDSGTAVAKIANFYKVNSSDIWAIHDDLDIKLGQYKVQQGVGPKVHNGVNSIEVNLGKKDFWRVRIGIENRQIANSLQTKENAGKMKGEEYVLQKFADEEMEILKGVIDDVTNELIKISTG